MSSRAAAALRQVVLVRPSLGRSAWARGALASDEGNDHERGVALKRFLAAIAAMAIGLCLLDRCGLEPDAHALGIGVGVRIGNPPPPGTLDAGPG
jgi:hypothetical protein